MVDIQIQTDAKAIKRRVDKMRREFVRELGKKLESELQEVSKIAAANTPVSTGNLKRSHFVRAPKVRGWNASVVIGAGNREAWYAAIVHEVPKRGWKFLEIPLMARVQRISYALDRWIERSLSRYGLQDQPRTSTLSGSRVYKKKR
jgi:hypothetical protein